MRTIHHVFSVSARPDRVFGALTSGEGLSGWWTTKVDVERHVGGHVRFTFGGAFNPDMEITMLREPESLEWRCVSSHENWTGNTFRFEPEPEGGSTRVRSWQHYARELADEDYGIYNYNWGYYLESLRLYCETGTGMPFDAEAGPASHEWTDSATPEGEPIMQARHRPRRSSPEQMATASRIRVRSALREPPRLTSRPRNSWYSGTARGGQLGRRPSGPAGERARRGSAVEVDDSVLSTWQVRGDIIAIGTTPSAITAEGRSVGRQES